MTRHDYRVRSLDAVLAGAEQAAEVEIEVSERLDATAHKRLFVGREPRTVAARDAFVRLVAQFGGAPLGTAVFRDVIVLGRGLVVEPRTRTVWTGESLGWSNSSVAMDLSAIDVSWTEGEAVPIDDERLSPARTVDAAMLLAQPGIGVYGHWLIDFVPRLQTWRKRHRDLPLLTGQTERWANHFAARFGADLSTAPAVLPRRPVEVRRLVAPTLTKRKQVLDRARTASAWDEFRNALMALPARRGLSAGERVYVSRANWPRGRALLNDTEVEERVAQHGFEVVRPESYNLRQQARIFRQARHIIGVDGSGLHNSLFARPGTILSVIDTDRTNLWHAGVANVRDQHVSHVGAVAVSDRGWYLPLDVLDRHLETISAAAAP